ncbi:hypothetical protein CLOM_g3000, partial [Closterium sp. NIES-68]
LLPCQQHSRLNSRSSYVANKSEPRNGLKNPTGSCSRDSLSLLMNSCPFSSLTVSRPAPESSFLRCRGQGCRCLPSPPHPLRGLWGFSFVSPSCSLFPASSRQLQKDFRVAFRVSSIWCPADGTIG